MFCIHDNVVFEKLRFRPSARKRQDGVFKNSTLTGDRFRKPVFWRPKRLPFTWGQKAKTEKKHIRFQKYPDTCGRGLRCVFLRWTRWLGKLCLILPVLFFLGSSNKSQAWWNLWSDWTACTRDKKDWYVLCSVMGNLVVYYYLIRISLLNICFPGFLVMVVYGYYCSVVMSWRSP